MRDFRFVSYIMLLVILGGSFHIHAFIHLESQASAIPILDEIIGTQIEPGVYSETDFLDLRYTISASADGIKLSINGSGYFNEFVNMEYLWRDDTTKYFKFYFQIDNYTTFKAYGTDGEGLIISEENYYLSDLDLSVHRLWTSNDKYPEFVSIDAEDDDVIEAVDFEYRTNNVALVEYKIKSQSNASLDIITDRSRVFSNPLTLQMNFARYEGDYQIFEYTLTLSERELWFKVSSQNSFEYNSFYPENSIKRRIHNGFKFNNTRLEVLRDDHLVPSSRLTDQDIAVIKFDVLNDTGLEFYKTEFRRTGVDKEVEILTLTTTSVESKVINGTAVSSYEIFLPPLMWKDQLTIHISSFDNRSNESIGVIKELIYIVHKWGVIVEIENLIFFTSSNEISVNYFINDIGDNGLLSAAIIVNNVSRKLALDQRSINVTLIEGINEIKVNITNGEGESSYAEMITRRDIVDPVIQGMNITQSGFYHRLVANISEIGEHDVGIESINVGINGIVYGVIVSEGLKQFSLYEQVNLADGENTITLEVKDLAGNVIERSAIYVISAASQTVDSTYIIPIIIAGAILTSIVTFVVIRRRRLL